MLRREPDGRAFRRGALRGRRFGRRGRSWIGGGGRWGLGVGGYECGRPALTPALSQKERGQLRADMAWVLHRLDAVRWWGLQVGWGWGLEVPGSAIGRVF